MKRHAQNDLDKAYVETSDIYIYTDIKVEKSHAPSKTRRWYFSLALYLLFIGSLIFSFFSLYDLNTLGSSMVVGLIFIVIVAYFVFFSTWARRHEKQILFACICGIALYFFILLLFVPSFTYGYKAVANHMIDLVNLRTIEFIIPYRLQAQYATDSNMCLFLLSSFVVISFAAAYAILCRPNIFVIIGSAFIPLIFGLSFGLVPSYIPFITLLSTCLLIAFLHLTTHASTIQKEYISRKDRNVPHHIISHFANYGENYSFGVKNAIVLICIAVATCLVSLAIFSPPVYNTAAVKQFRKTFYALTSYQRNESSRPHPSYYNGQVNQLADRYFGLTSRERIDIDDKKTLNSVDRYNNQLISIRTPSFGQTIYLKGFVGANYDGAKWVSIQKDEQALSSEQFSQVFKQSGHQVQNLSSDYIQLNNKIQNPALQNGYAAPMQISLGSTYDLATKRFTYIPYGAIYPTYVDETRTHKGTKSSPQREKCEFDLDSTVYTNLTQWAGAYKFTYFATESLLDVDMDRYLQDAAAKDSDVADLARREAAYRQFVYKQYTKIPGNTLSQLKKDYTPERVKEAGSLSAYCEKIRADLSRYKVNYINNIYTKTDKDFIETFLYDSGTGHDSHFASAAVMMFRASGIPARYVEGFVIDPEQQFVEEHITDKTDTVVRTNGEQYNANEYVFSLSRKTEHAWVEIYLDGYGWVPVEMMPTVQQITKITPQFTAQVGQEQQPNLDIDFSSSNNSGSAENGVDTHQKNAQQKYFAALLSRIFNIDPKTMFAYIGIVFVLILIVFVVISWLRRFIVLQGIKRKFYSSDPHKNTINLYKYVCEVIESSGIPAEVHGSYAAFADTVEDHFHGAIKQGEFQHLVQFSLAVGFGNPLVSPKQVTALLDICQRMLTAIIARKGFIKRFKLKWHYRLW